MVRPRKRTLGTVLIAFLTLVVIAGCSATGGKRAADAQAAAAAGAARPVTPTPPGTRST